MSGFSRYLEQKILSSGMTEKQLSKISGFTRSYIALMKNGQRVSPDTEKIVRLFHALNLSMDEYEYLWSEYIRARMGDVVYERTAAVLDVIHSFNNISKAFIKSVCKHDIPDVKTIENRLDMEYMISAVIENEAMKENGFVSIIMQGRDNILTKTLPGICKKNKNLVINHIVCMEKYADAGLEKDYLYNVRMLKELIPIVIFSGSTNYRVYYYYDHVTSRFNSGTLLPYMVLTSDCLICMNSDLNKGMVSKDPEIMHLYETMFRKQQKNCREMFLHTKDLSDMVVNFPKTEDMENITYSVAQQPCFGVLKVSGLLRRYCQPGKESLIPILENAVRKNEQWISEQGNKHIAYCSRSGLERFVHEGVVDELPKEVYSPLSIWDRKRMLQMLLEKIEEGSCELYFLDEAVACIPEELFIHAYSISDVLLMYMGKEQSRVILSESSLTRMLYESFQNLMKNPCVSEKDEAKTYIEELLNTVQE